MERGNFEGKGMPRHARGHSDVSCAKTAEPIEMPFGLCVGYGLDSSGLRKHYRCESRSPCEGATFRGKDMPMHARRSCAKRLN